MRVFFSFTALDERRSIFSLETFTDRKFLTASGLSSVAILLGTELNILNRFLNTTSLTGPVWAIRLLVPFGIVAASELWKLFLRSRERQERSERTPIPAAATSGS